MTYLCFTLSNITLAADGSCAPVPPVTPTVTPTEEPLVSYAQFLGMVIASVLLFLFIIIIFCFCCCRASSIMNRQDRDQDSVEV